MWHQWILSRHAGASRIALRSAQDLDRVLISADGRFVAFTSGATDPAPGGEGGVFVRDRQTHTTTRTPIPGAPAPGRPSKQRRRTISGLWRERRQQRAVGHLLARPTDSVTRQVSLNREGDPSLEQQLARRKLPELEGCPLRINVPELFRALRIGGGGRLQHLLKRAQDFLSLKTFLALQRPR